MEDHLHAFYYLPMPPLSTPSPFKTGTYVSDNNLFFAPSKALYAQVTEIFDEIWPTVTALKYLRQQVEAYYKEHPTCSTEDLCAAFVEESDKTNRPNLYRTCIANSWEDTEVRISNNLLMNLFACYEQWTLEISAIFSSTSRNTELQFPDRGPGSRSFKTFLTHIKRHESQISSSLYELYKNNVRYNLTAVNNWLLFYRYFKECRNCMVHNGGKANQTVVNAYSAIEHLNLTDLKVKEIPQTIPPELDAPLQFVLRGVVGFSQIILNIVATLDIEFIQGQLADNYFYQEIRNSINRLPYPTDFFNKQHSTRKLLGRNHFKCPSDTTAIYNLLKQEGIMR